MLFSSKKFIVFEFPSGGRLTLKNVKILCDFLKVFYLAEKAMLVILTVIGYLYGQFDGAECI